LKHVLALGWEAREQEGGVLVRAVLGPEKREDGELEAVRLSAEPPADAVQLPVGEPEGAMKRLFGDCRQTSSV
jgi:hypothetical protein